MSTRSLSSAPPLELDGNSLAADDSNSNSNSKATETTREGGKYDERLIALNPLRELQLVMVSFGLISSLAAVILISLWSVAGPVADGYLGIPSWANNDELFAWHPILMTAGVFLSMVLALSSFVVTPQQVIFRQVVKICHACLQFAAIGFLVAGVIAVTTYKNAKLEANLTENHEWIGVAAMSTYFLNLLLGIFRSLNFINPDPADAILRLNSPVDTSAVAFRQVATTSHWILGLATVYFVTLAIVTGISTYLSSGGYCSYSVNQRDLNPASRYSELPGACKIGNGLGVAVSTAAFFVGVSTVISITSIRAGNVDHPKPEEDRARSPINFSGGEEKEHENGGRPSMHL